MKKLQSANSAKHLRRVRHLCAALPESTEKLSHGEPTFFVRQKVFCMFANNHHHDGHIAVWLPAPIGIQEMLIATAPEKYFKPPYVGVRGWVGVELARVNDEELDFLVRQAWRQIAPKTLQNALTAPDDKIKKTVHGKNDLGAMISAMLEGLPGVNVKKSANRLSFLVGKKVFAFTQRGRVVIKLPQEKIKTLAEKKTASFLVMGKKEMKEWAVIKHKDPKEYKKDFKLFKTAMAFVSSKEAG